MRDYFVRVADAGTGWGIRESVSLALFASTLATHDRAVIP